MSLDINRSTRRRPIELLSEAERAQPEFSGDFRPQGAFDFFRSAEILLPSEIDAVKVAVEDKRLYGTRFYVGLVPPGDQQISEAQIDLTLAKPIARIKAWRPSDLHSLVKSSERKVALTAEASSAKLFPQLGELLLQVGVGLPSLTARVDQTSERHIEHHASLVRAMTDGQSRLTFQLFADPKTGKDQRQLVAEVLFALDRDEAPAVAEAAMELEVSCKSGLLGMRRAVVQAVDLVFAL